MNKMSKEAEHPTAETIKWMRLFLSLEKRKQGLAARPSRQLTKVSKERRQELNNMKANTLLASTKSS